MPEKRIIFQTKEEYYTEQYQRLRFIWWIVVSVLFTSIFYFIIKSLQKLLYIFLIFLALFIIADLTKNKRLRAYIRTIIGFFYLVWAIISIVIFILMRSEEGSFFLIIIAIVFLILSYKDFKKHTNFIEIILAKLKI